MTITSAEALTSTREPVVTPSDAANPIAIAVAAPYGAAGPKIYGTSTSTVTIASAGTATFVIVEDGRAFTVGTRVRATAGVNWMEGVVTAWDANAKTLQLTADLSNGSGSYNAWNINVAGERGAVGPVGPKGDPGTPGGPPGPAGAPGASTGNKYTFNTAVTGDPGTGRFHFNNATPASATVLSISEVDGAGMLMTPMLAAIDDGTSANKSIVRFIASDGTMGFIGYVTGTLTDQGNWDDYPWTPITSWGTPATGQVMYMSWSRVGDKGDKGDQGIQGPVGPQGIIAEAPTDGGVYGRKGSTASWATVTPATAATVPFTPAGNIASTNVQTALQELDTEKATPADVTAAVAAKVSKSGDSMSGLLTLSGDPTSALHAVTKQYSDAVASRNLFINGGLNVTQDYTWGQQAALVGTPRWPADCWIGACQHAMITPQMRVVYAKQDVGHPWGYACGIGMFQLWNSGGTTTSWSTNEFVNVAQNIEAARFNELAWGTAKAKPLTIAWWMQAGASGVMTVSVRNKDNNRCYCAPVTITGGVLKLYSVTIPGDTAGTWLQNYGALGARITFCFGAGSAFAAPSANTWLAANYIAAPTQSNNLLPNGASYFMNGFVAVPGAILLQEDVIPNLIKPYDLELPDCQRFYAKSYAPDEALGATTGNSPITRTPLQWTTTQLGIGGITVDFPRQMAFVPTVTIWNPATGAAGSIWSVNTGTGVSTTGTVAGINAAFDRFSFNCTTTAGAAAQPTEISFHYHATARLQ